jgi:hypothetical protein
VSDVSEKSEDSERLEKNLEKTSREATTDVLNRKRQDITIGQKIFKCTESGDEPKREGRQT